MLNKIKKLAKYLKEPILFKLAAEIADQWEDIRGVLNDYLMENNLNTINDTVEGIKNLVAYTYSPDPTLKKMADMAWEKCYRADLILKAFAKLIPPGVLLQISEDILDLIYQESPPAINAEIQAIQDQFYQLTKENIQMNFQELMRMPDPTSYDFYITNDRLSNIRLNIFNLEQNQDIDNYFLEALKEFCAAISMSDYNQSYAKNLGEMMAEFYGNPKEKDSLYQDSANLIKKHLNLNNFSSKIKPELNQDDILNLHKKLSTQSILDPHTISEIIQYHLPDLYDSKVSQRILINLAKHPNTSLKDLRILADTKDGYMLHALVQNPNLPKDFLQTLKGIDPELDKYIELRKPLSS